MSRYNDLPYRGPPTERWDGDRFARERNGRNAVLEREQFEERDRYRSDDRGYSERRDVSFDDYIRRDGPRDRGFEEDRFYEREERYGPPARRAPAREDFRERYHEEEYDRYEESPRRFGGRRPAPPRPGMLIRRQSSLDTFDRRPLPRYAEPEVVTVPSPRGGRFGQDRHRYEPRYAERDYDDIRIAEPDWYGDENFRGFKEREVETIRRRRPEPPVEEIREKEVEEVEEIVEEEKPWPRRGKTRMSARLVNKRALVQLGYPYEDEFTDAGDFVIILKALNKELIDEVLALSKEVNERVTLQIEGPTVEKDEIIERREIVITDPAEVPRSVRDWDVMAGTAVGSKKSEREERASVHGSLAPSAKSRHTHRSKSAHGSRSERRSEHRPEHKSDNRSEHRTEYRSERHSSHHSRRSSSGGGSTVKNEQKSVKRSRSRSRSPSRVSKKSEKKSMRSSSPSPVTIERKRSKSRRRSRSSIAIKTEVVDNEIGESNSMHPGPLALVVPKHERHDSKSERRIKEEIRELEAEKRRLKRERRESKHDHDSSDDEVIIERTRSGSHGRRESVVKIDKDRKDSRILKGMLATLT